MGTLFSKDIPKGADINTIRDARTKYQDYLASVQANTNSDVSTNALTPETGSSIYKLIETSYDWLKKNPNANLNEILANQDAATVEVKRLVSVDIPKRKFNNTLLALPTILDKLVADKTITADKKSAFLPTIVSEQAWYTKNQSKASQIEYNQEFQKINDTITTTFVDHAVVNTIKTQLDAAQAIPTSQLNSQLADYDSKQKALENQKVDIQNSGQIIISTALKVFGSLLLIAFCIMCGSFAANMAIGRPPMYRVLYFIYGAIPFFAPFVLIYTIYKRIKEGRISVYTILPTSIEPATTRLGKILWHPFYWIPDQHAIDEYNAFMDALPQQVA
jgi:hypothetical protein